MLYVRTTENERWWKEARERAASVGLHEESDGERYWAYVTQVFERLRTSAPYALKKDGGIRAYIKKPAYEKLLEQLAELEHQQWMAWTRAIAKRGVVAESQVTKWRKDWVPYDSLPEPVKEQDRLWARKAMRRAEMAGLMSKSAAAKQKAKPHEPKSEGIADNLARRAVIDGHVLAQRPDHPMPVAGRVTGVGEHGIHMKDDKGKTHKVRHEHVMDHLPPITEEEWPEAARALYEQGFPIDPNERFAAPGGGRPEDQKAMLEEIAANGAPIDVETLLAEGSPEDIQAVIDKYVDDEPRPSSLPTAVERDRIAEAPGWRKVNPDAKGRVSMQKKTPPRSFEADSDGARDEAFDAIKKTGLVGKVQIDPDSKPEDQEHLLRTVAQMLRSIADVVEPQAIKPNLIVGGERATGAKGTHVGARYDRHAKVLEVGLGLPESVVHAYGHVVDASYGGGKYASLDPKSPVGQLVAQLKGSRGVSKFEQKISKTEKPEREKNSNSTHRFWAAAPETFARFFEQWVDHAIQNAGSPNYHHAWVIGVEQPGVPDPDEMAGHAHSMRRTLGQNDRSQMLRMTRGRTGVSKQKAEVAAG